LCNSECTRVQTQSARKSSRKRLLSGPWQIE
jgi:hypothetical protein